MTTPAPFSQGFHKAEAFPAEILNGSAHRLYFCWGAGQASSVHPGPLSILSPVLPLFRHTCLWGPCITSFLGSSSWPPLFLRKAHPDPLHPHSSMPSIRVAPSPASGTDSSRHKPGTPWYTFIHKRQHPGRAWHRGCILASGKKVIQHFINTNHFNLN